MWARSECFSELKYCLECFVQALLLKIEIEDFGKCLDSVATQSCRPLDQKDREQIPNLPVMSDYLYPSSGKKRGKGHGMNRTQK